MTNLGFRLIGSAIIAAAGGITMGLGELASRNGPANGIGGMMVLVGVTLFVIDWIMSVYSELKSEFPANQAK